ncbi:MAG: 50S ribosomal protein L29 [Acidobacteriota bacterium]|nr:50S ribosomal protein L29 [Acidobacteriota bacterium]
MAELDAENIRQLTDDEIEEEIERAHDEIARLRYRAAFEELENPLLLRTRRRDLARLKTIKNERAAVAASGESIDV